MRWLIPIVLFLVSFAGAHFIVLSSLPSTIMSRVMGAMQERGLEPHRFQLAPRITPQSQTVVRPSPDLAYSICLFDFTGEVDALGIYAAPWPGYASISFFDEETVNFATVSGGEGGGAIAPVMLLAPGASAPDGTDSLQQIQATGETGIILIRRLAPRAIDYTGVALASSEDRCQPFINETP